MFSSLPSGSWLPSWSWARIPTASCRPSSRARAPGAGFGQWATSNETFENVYGGLSKLGSLFGSPYQRDIYRYRYRYRCRYRYRFIIWGVCPNCGPFVGPLDARCRIRLRTHKGTMILTTIHIHLGNRKHGNSVDERTIITLMIIVMAVTRTMRTAMMTMVVRIMKNRMTGIVAIRILKPTKRQ